MTVLANGAANGAATGTESGLSKTGAVDRALTERIRAAVVEQLGHHPNRDRLELADQRQLVREIGRAHV